MGRLETDKYNDLTENPSEVEMFAFAFRPVSETVGGSPFPAILPSLSPSKSFPLLSSPKKFPP